MKKTIRFYATMALAKCMIVGMRLLGKNATNLPGEVALILCPTFLGQLDKPETIIGVTGTNGKTTVTNMIVDVLEKNGYIFASNRMGGNVDTGITTALIKESTLSGKARKKLAVLEIDERSANRIYPYLTPTYLVCTNLFRDSAKRNAHPEFISQVLNTYIPAQTKMILNGDDLISGRLAPDNERVYFGIEPQPDEVPITDNIINDMDGVRFCAVQSYRAGALQPLRFWLAGGGLRCDRGGSRCASGHHAHPIGRGIVPSCRQQHHRFVQYRGGGRAAAGIRDVGANAGSIV